MLLSILRILSYILGIAGSALLLPLAVAAGDGDRRMALVFLVPFLAGWAAAAVFWLAVRKRPKVFDVKSAFSVVGLIWIALFMLLASVNFALYYRLFTGRIRDVARDSELHALALVVLVSTVVAAWLEHSPAAARPPTTERCRQPSNGGTALRCLRSVSRYTRS